MPQGGASAPATIAMLCCFSVASSAAAPVCAGCHPKEVARYAASPMGNSLIAPQPLKPGRFTHERSHSVITSEEREGRMIHTIAEAGLTAEHAVRYQIGGQLMGRGYLVQIGDYLFESPASWFNRYGWDLSPGYASAPTIDFDRAMNEECLFCHAGAARFSDADGRRVQGPALTPITCERCHGAAEEHVRHPSARNIVNPAKLAGAARDSVCEQCHLEGATRILNPGKSWTDFHAGQAAEETFATYLLSGGGNREIIAVSHVEQLAQSKCARASNGKLWCGTCHAPHGDAADRGRQVRAICMSCHPALSKTAHRGAPEECTSCHMPRSSTTDIPHAALTDHRILRRATAEPNEASAEKLVVWREPPAAFRTRDLGLAEVLAGYSKRLRPVAEDGIHLLEALPSGQQDADVLSDLEGLRLQQGRLQEAAELGHRVVELRLQSAKAAMNLGIVLKRLGDSEQAEKQLARAIDLDPSLKQAYMELATLYAAQRRTADMMAAIDRFLKWNPQDILFRLQKSRAEGAH